MAGWVKLHRKIRECDLWLEKPFSRGQAWMDMIIEANHKDRNVLHGTKIILVTRGSYITSIRKMSERWGWSNTKVVAFMAYLKSEGMITYKSDTKKTVVTIENYGVYQDSEEEETTQKRHRNDTETTQKHTTNNDKKEKKEKKDIIYTPSQQQILDLWNSKGFRVKTQPTENLKRQITKAINERTEEKLIQAIDHYAVVLNDQDFYYNYEFDLKTFLERKAQVPKFLDDGEIWVNYLKQKGGKQNGLSEKVGGNSTTGEGKYARARAEALARQASGVQNLQ